MRTPNYQKQFARGRQTKACKPMMACNACPTENVFYYTVSQGKNKAKEILLSCSNYISFFPLHFRICPKKSDAQNSGQLFYF